MTYSISHLQQFMSTARNLQVKTVTLYFEEDYLYVLAYPHKEASLDNLDMTLGGKHFNWQIVYAAQVFYAFSTVFSVVEDLTLTYRRQNMSSEWDNQADCIHWRKVLEPFVKVKNLSVDGGLVKQLSVALEPGEEESPMELLPELQELSYSASGDSRKDSRNAFTQFADTHQKASRPVTVVQF